MGGREVKLRVQKIGKVEITILRSSVFLVVSVFPTTVRALHRTVCLVALEE